MIKRLRRKGDSGCTLWHGKVRKTYASVAELESYDSIYGNVTRCGYKSAAALWKANPMLQGSTNPGDFGVALYVTLRKDAANDDPLFKGHPWLLEHGDGSMTGYKTKAEAAKAMRAL